MTVQHRRPRAVQCKGRAGRPLNYVMFVGKVVENRRTYEEGGEDRRVEAGKLSKAINGICTHREGTEREWGFHILPRPPLPTPTIYKLKSTSRIGKIGQAYKRHSDSSF